MRNLPFTPIAVALLTVLPACAGTLGANADLLATNTVVAVYEKTVDRPCMHLTSLCPDRCGHADRLAVFRVVTNEQYSRPGEYGDDKAEPGSPLYISVLKDPEGQDPAIRQLVSSLSPGDQVRFTLDHYYIRSERAHYPVRPVSHMEIVARDTSKAATPNTGTAPAPTPTNQPTEPSAQASPVPTASVMPETVSAEPSNAAPTIEAQPTTTEPSAAEPATTEQAGASCSTPAAAGTCQEPR